MPGITAEQRDQLQIEKLAQFGAKRNLANAKVHLQSMRNLIKAGAYAHYRAGLYLRTVIYCLQAAQVSEPESEELFNIAGDAIQGSIVLDTYVDKRTWDILYALRDHHNLIKSGVTIRKADHYIGIA